MHAYDVPRRPSFTSVPPVTRLRSGGEVPLSRSSQDPSGGSSATPIYDALYAEWVRSYRALPGDRHGEEELGFQNFASIPHGSGGYRSYSPGTYGGGPAPATYATGRLTPRQDGGRENGAGRDERSAGSGWQPVGRMPTGHTGMHHIPALPPGPRRGH